VHQCTLSRNTRPQYSKYNWLFININQLGTLYHIWFFYRRPCSIFFCARNHPITFCLILPHCTDLNADFIPPVLFFAHLLPPCALFFRPGMLFFSDFTPPPCTVFCSILPPVPFLKDPLYFSRDQNRISFYPCVIIRIRLKRLFGLCIKRRISENLLTTSRNFLSYFSHNRNMYENNGYPYIFLNDLF